VKLEERHFDSWLKHRALDAVTRVRSLLEAPDDEDENTDDKSSDDEEMSSDDSDGSDDVEQDMSDETRGGPQKAKAARRETPAPSPDDLSMEQIIDKLNAIRSGKSLKDKGVRERIGAYFEDLNSVQRLALFAFLEGLAEVVASEVPGDDARAPNDPDIGVDMTQTASEKDVETRKEQPRVVKSQSSGENNMRRVQQTNTATRKQQSASVPQISKDAGDDSPVFVVKR